MIIYCNKVKHNNKVNNICKGIHCNLLQIIIQSGKAINDGTRRNINGEINKHF